MIKKNKKGVFPEVFGCGSSFFPLMYSGWKPHLRLFFFFVERFVSLFTFCELTLILLNRLLHFVLLSPDSGGILFLLSFWLCPSKLVPLFQNTCQKNNVSGQSLVQIHYPFDTLFGTKEVIKGDCRCDL